jgi:GNAT superfamily N-acetyltransferase
MADSIRPATAQDVPAILGLAEKRRALYATFQPRFWQVASDARERHEPHLRALLNRDDHAALVCERDGALAGFVIGRLMPSPPVYDPGTPVFDVHDFVVADPEHWGRTGAMLLDRANDEARRRGAILSIVITGQRDAPKRAMLAAERYAPASGWWVREL